MQHLISSPTIKSNSRDDPDPQTGPTQTGSRGSSFHKQSHNGQQQHNHQHYHHHLRLKMNSPGCRKAALTAASFDYVESRSGDIFDDDFGGLGSGGSGGRRNPLVRQKCAFGRRTAVIDISDTEDTVSPPSSPGSATNPQQQQQQQPVQSIFVPPREGTITLQAATRRLIERRRKFGHPSASVFSNKGLTTATLHARENMKPGPGRPMSFN